MIFVHVNQIHVFEYRITDVRQVGREWGWGKNHNFDG
jgi:hypothetical protein